MNKQFRVFHLIYSETSGEVQSNVWVILPTSLIPKYFSNTIIKYVVMCDKSIISSVMNDSIAYYHTCWDFTSSESRGIFLSVKPPYRGLGLSSYLYILNAHEAQNQGIIYHLADFSATSGLSNTEYNKVFNKLYGKLSMKLIEPGMPEMFGYTSVISGNTVTRVFYRNYVCNHPSIYNSNEFQDVFNC